MFVHSKAVDDGAVIVLLLLYTTWRQRPIAHTDLHGVTCTGQPASQPSGRDGKASNVRGIGVGQETDFHDLCIRINIEVMSMAKQCEMIIGFLIPRRCDQPARSTCIRCGRRVCDEHATISPEGILCEACHEGAEQLTTEAPPEWVSALPDYDPQDVALFDQEDLTTDSMFDDLS
jgi:hypothetical protein